MTRKEEQLLYLGIGFAAAVILATAAVLSGALPWALAFGLVSFLVTLKLAGDFKTASSVSGSGMALIMLVGALNYLFPGWYQHLILG